MAWSWLPITPYLLLVAAAPAAGRTVEIAVVADTESADRLKRTLVELLGRLQIAVRFSRIEEVDLGRVSAGAANQDPLVARVWLDAQEGPQHPATAGLYVLDPVAGRMLVRQIPLPQGLDELAREQIAHVIADAVGAVLEGREVGAPLEEVRPFLPTGSGRSTGPAAPDFGRRSLELGAGLLYEVQRFSDGQALTKGPGLLVGVMSRGAWAALGGVLLAEARETVDVAGDRVGLRLAQVHLRALATVDLPLTKRLSLFTGLGAAAEIVRMEPSSSEAGVELTPARRRVSLAISGLVGLSMRLSYFSFMAAGTADGPPRTRYVVERAAGRDSLLSTSPVRPGIMVAVTLNMDGP